MKSISSFILRWFTKHGRDLPWRHTTNPWLILASEAMLQQTQVSRVLPKYEEFIGRWPTPGDFAHISLAEVLRFWSGLGYNRRAKSLWMAAKKIVVDFGGEVPMNENDLRSLPGVGKYTARAVLSFAANRDVACSDTNIRRIFLRILSGGEFTKKILDERKLGTVLVQNLPRGKSRAWHNALMDFGSLVCTSRDPQCVSCPLLRVCKSGPHFLAGKKPTQKLLRPQKKFSGSRRQVRGAIIRAALTSSSLTIDVLQKKFPDHDVAMIVKQLAKEGFIRTRGSRIALPH